MAESTRQRKAFEIYFSLGGHRSIERLRRRLHELHGKAPSLRSLYEWSSRYQWQNKIAGLEQEARDAFHDETALAFKEMYKRQAQAGIFLQQKGMEIVQASAEKATPEAGMRAIVEGAKLERMARGDNRPWK